MSGLSDGFEAEVLAGLKRMLDARGADLEVFEWSLWYSHAVGSFTSYSPELRTAMTELLDSTAKDLAEQERGTVEDDAD